ncbi:MAG TPA: hypothetical protein VF532_00540 [Candidatus Angelobacter sp.]
MLFEFSFPKNYEARVLESEPPVHPVEKLYHYPVELEEGDRSGVYVRVVPQQGPAWAGFFAQGFDSSQVLSAVCSCPDADSVCVIAGGYAYVVKANDPARWFRINQQPVAELRVLTRQDLALFAGFTTITALGREGVAWTTERLSWEGLRLGGTVGDTLRGMAWDAISDKEVPFEVDLKTGKHSGGASPVTLPQN